jgi:hypothetical protein
LLKDSLSNNDKQSARRNAMGIPKSSFSRMVKEINFVPYKVRSHQELQPADFVDRQRFCQWWRTAGINVDNLMVLDEANFNLGIK